VLVKLVVPALSVWIYKCGLSHQCDGSHHSEWDLLWARRPQHMNNTSGGKSDTGREGKVNVDLYNTLS